MASGLRRQIFVFTNYLFLNRKFRAITELFLVYRITHATPAGERYFQQRALMITEISFHHKSPVLLLD